MSVTSELAAEKLSAVIDRSLVVTDTDIVNSYVHDEAEWAAYGKPLAVVRPRSTQDVQAIVRACAELGVPIVPRGAGTGLSGGANAIDGCVMVSLAAMNAIIQISAEDKIAVVQPGIVNDDLRTACAEHGLWYPPDPASSPWSTIGGNVSTNAGGVCCVKYGVTRDYVLGIQVVLANGEAVRLGRRTMKGVAGLDLCGLFVGSEGTLGIITEITVRLRSARAAEQTVVGYFDTLRDAGQAVSNIAASEVVPSALELMDKYCLLAVDEWTNMGLSSEGDVLLLGRTDAPGESGEREAEIMLECMERAGATWSVRSTDQEEADALFQARRLAYPALERLGPVLCEDVCVPRSLVPEMLLRIEAIAKKYETQIATVAHAGDGNLHPMILAPVGDDEARVRGLQCYEAIISEAIAMGGTITGEHGVGLLKVKSLVEEVGPVVMDLHRSVKQALDPNGLFNPGKMFAAQS